MSTLVIGQGTRVTLHFALRLTNGEVVDSNFDHEPAIFTVGDGNFLDGFEQVLMGLAVGDEKTFTLAPDAAFGQPREENIQTFKRSQFGHDIQLEKGLMLNFSDSQNNELTGVVSDFDDERASIDFNHPLAGKTIYFDVKILAIDPVVTH